MPIQSRTPPPTKKKHANPPVGSGPSGPDLPSTPVKKATASLIVPNPGTPGRGSLQYKQIQKDEVDVLQSIYMDDYQHIEKTGAWNTSDHAFKLRLKAYSDKEYSCVLTVTMTATYPKSAPELSLSLSPNIIRHREILENIIKERPRTLLGQEMIHEIATAIQDTLEDIVQNRLVDIDKPSLDQERALKAISEQKRAEEEEQEIRLQKELEAIEEQKKLDKEIEDERRRQRVHAKESHEKRKISSVTEDESSGIDTDDCILFDRAIQINLSNTSRSLVFRKVCGMVKIATGPAMSVYTVRPAYPVHGAKNLPLVLKQVDFPNSFIDSAQGKRQIQNLEQELENLKALRHPHVIDMYESKVSRNTSITVAHNESSTPDSWRVSILTEYADGGSLHGLLKTAGSLNVDIARSWTISLLEGLDYVHKQGAVHKGIHAGNILLFHCSSDETTVPKFADISYTKSIHEITNKGNSFIGSAKSAFWFPPEISQADESSTYQTTRKCDIWNFGIVFLQMIFGLKILETYESPQKLLHSMELSESLSDFIESIFRTDPKKRPTAFELLPSEFLRNDDPITDVSARASSPKLPRMSWSMAKPPLRHQNRHRHSNSMVVAGISRYANDFVELGRLGKGGYGSVVKARNRLDGREYAIKQITQRSGAKLTGILSEVMLLSRLNHQYVVRYFTAWLEEDEELVHGGFNDTYDEDSEAISFTGSSGSKTRSGASIQPNNTEELSESESGSESGSGTEGASGSGSEMRIEFGSSAGGLDFISNSAGYPKVQFGYGSDEESDESGSIEEDEYSESKSKSKSAEENALRRTTSNERKRGKLTLYIQMSLAEKLTLRDRIRQGLSIEESWKLLRQILEGLAHIHGLGIIHRDLKPENIFIDMAGDPQIGDFGLATNELVVDNSMARNASQLENIGENELTTNVGTALYVAPELKIQGKGNYNEKVDMYSLGVIFFEMCYPLGSGMERAQVLTSLREPEINFPPDFWNEKRNDQGSIIKRLLSHNSKDRPTSLELLNSGEMPFMIEDTAVRHALQSLSNPNTPYHSQVMKVLFSQNTKQYKDHTYDIENRPLSCHDLLLQGLVKERLVDIFRTHGAVETTRSLLLPRSKFYSRDVAQLIDPNGTLVQLPYDLTLPHARFLARESSPAPKTFTFGTVYRENSRGGQPRSHGEVDFDIISYDSLDLSLKEAEVIKVVDEVIDAFPSLKGAQICYHINHSSLLDAIMDFCRIKSSARGHAKEILSNLNLRQRQWSKIRNELVTSKLGILPTSLDDLARFDWRDEPENAFKRLQEIFEGTNVLDKVQSIFVHMRAVSTYLKSFGVHRKVFVNPLGIWNDKFYRGGLVFQCLYDIKKRDVFAAGGRYDSLIQDHSPKARSEVTHAVGCNIGWEQLFTSMSKYQRNLAKSASASRHGAAEEEQLHTTGPWATRRCDVIVSSFDNTALRTQGISLLQELWANGIHAELGHSSAIQENVYHAYKQEGVSWIVTVKPDLISGDLNLRVKSLNSKTDVPIKHSEIISHLKGELAERDRKSLSAERQYLPTKLLRHTSADTTARLVGDEPSLDVRVLAADRKGRKINRGAIIDAAQRASLEISATLLKLPVAAVDVKENILDEIKHLRVTDADGWKKLVNNSLATDRKYISQVQELLEELQGEGHNEVLLYSFRTGGGRICYLV
ncbi:kinase-like domain-containing protein [Geopyxis carbonaria]|nr:kinase-like domain-containing protein [Geopyxis carbonaria]